MGVSNKGYYALSDKEYKNKKKTIHIQLISCTSVVLLGKNGLSGGGASTEAGGNMYIGEQLNMDLNGVPQFVSIRAEKEKAPLLVYLHGARMPKYMRKDFSI